MRDDPRSPGYQIPLPPVTGGWSLTDHPAGAGSTASRPDAGCWMLDPPSRPRPIPRPRLIADERSKSLSFGRTGVPATRPLPGAFPEGAPCHNVGTPKNRPAGWRWSQHCERRHARTGALSSACRSHRLSDTRGDLSPLPVGAPLDNVGTRRDVPFEWPCSQHCQERHPAEGERAFAEDRLDLGWVGGPATSDK
jgi:hypothetical protein